jgi:phosphatidylserine/phosphatidylglycerophosphate/cardiolipin synthase-like enzyme
LTASGTRSGPTAAAKGLARPLINGRSSNGKFGDVDLTEPLDEMQKSIQRLGKGDFVYLAAWFFEPATQLTAGAYKAASTWGALLAAKATEGVKVRILINDFDEIPGVGLADWVKTTSLDPLDKIIEGMPKGSRDNLKYIVHLHPAHVGGFKSRVAGMGGRKIHAGSHHEKFMVIWHGADEEMVAFCGGLDIESRKTPDMWSYVGLYSWHDIHMRLEGLITRDVEREFVARWNLNRTSSRRGPLDGWKPMEQLSSTPPSRKDTAPSRNIHNLRVIRTRSEDGTLGIYKATTTEIKDAYRRAIGKATDFIYMENQYFRSPELGDWIASQGKKNSKLVVIMVVVASAEADDGDNPITAHGNHLQYETFSRIMDGLGARARIYTMLGRAVHSKFMLIDDKWMTIGSANANVRSFELDSELNIEAEDSALARDFRIRLWAHNLGKSEGEVRSWMRSDFIAKWDLVAGANARLITAPQDMDGEGILSLDYTRVKGRKYWYIPDGLARFDPAPEGAMFGSSACRMGRITV